jgi:hypothetical protein
MRSGAPHVAKNELLHRKQIWQVVKAEKCSGVREVFWGSLR